MLFIGSCGGVFYAVDRNTGKELWSYDTRTDGGPRSFHGDPLLHDGLVLVTTDRGCGPNTGFVYAFDQQSGKLRWKMAASGPSTSFARLGTSVIFGTSQDEWKSVDIRSGKVNWTFASAFPDPQCESRKSPETDGVDVYFFTHDNNLHALAPTGRSLWTYTSPAPVTTGLISYKDILYFGAGDHLYGVNPSNGRVISQLKLDARSEGAFAWTSVEDGELEYVFATRDENGQKLGMLLAFNDEFAKLMWSQKSPREWSSEKPHIWKGLIIAGNCRGELAAYRAADGAPQWRDSLKGCIRSIADDGGLLYIGTQEGTVYAYTPPLQ